MKQAGFFDVEERLKRVSDLGDPLSDLGDPLEVMTQVIDFEGFRPLLERALARSDRAKGGRPPFDPTVEASESDMIMVSGMNVLRLKGRGTSYAESFLHPDHLGSAVAATNGSRTVLWRESYTPYGEKRLDPAANQNEMSFTGHVEDTDTGLTAPAGAFSV